MNRAEAAREIDETLARSLAAWQDGRCPNCEAVFLPRRDRWQPDSWRPGEFTRHGVVHAAECPYPASHREDAERLHRLARRFGFRLGLQMVEVQSGVALLALRRETKGAV